MKKYSIEKPSCAFSGIRSMGLFAPLSYWKSDEDWGIGDMDVLLKVIDFAKKLRISIISLLPLNIPRLDNCPYANASAYVFDPVYIGISMLLRDFGMEKGGADYSPEIDDLISSFSEKIEDLRKRSTSANDEIREVKYKVLKALFRKFEEKFATGISDIADILTGSRLSPCPLERFKSYCISNEWLGDHLLFFILAKKFNTDNFRKWPGDIARRSPEVIQELKEKHKSEILFEAFLQWILTEQLQYIRKKAAEGEFKLDIMMDQPFAFGHADVWCCPEAFVIDPATLKTEYTQGAPPHRLDIPQHWQFYLLNTDNPASKELMLKRLCFFLKFSDLLRIDHVLGYYRLYYMTEDENQDMTLEKMGIWDEIEAVFKSSVSSEKKRERIYNLIMDGIKVNFHEDMITHLFDNSGNLKHAHVILAARKNSGNVLDERSQSGWYTQGENHEGHPPIYTLLSPNEFTDMDYLKKIIEEKEMFLMPSDSIRAGFFKPGYGEEIISAFMHTAQLQGKTLVFESLGVVTDQIAISLRQLGAAEFKPLIFGYQYFTGDDSDFWFNRIRENSYVCFSTQDTVTIRGWWEGREKWAEKKYYFENIEQKRAVINWLIYRGYLDKKSEIDLEKLNTAMLDAVLESVADSRGNTVVIMMSNIFGSGDEGVINMPGYKGFWTARSPLSIEAMMMESGHKGNPSALEAVERIKFLAQKRNRHDFRNQIKNLDTSSPQILATHPLMGEGSKQVRLYGEEFLIDALIYGTSKSYQVSLVFDNGRREAMKKVEVKNGLFPNMNIFRTCIPVNKEMLAVSSFQIEIDGHLYPDKGYLIGCFPGTDMNPVSEKYGDIINS